MKNTFRISLAVLAISLMPAGGHMAHASAQQPVGALPRVIAVETFLADMAQNIAGNRIKVTSLLPVGADPHSYEPTPKDVAKVVDSNLVIINGAGFEEFLNKLLQNAGGVHKIIEASAGLSSRSMREGEVAEMSDADFADAMCDGTDKAGARPLQAGRDAGSAVEVPEESGSFDVLLTKQADGGYGGYLKYVTDEKGDFQIAGSDGQLQIFKASNSSPLGMERTVPLNCGRLVQGHIAELEKDGEYVIALSGFKTERASFLIGPLGGHHHHEGDPHFWLNPDNVIEYVQNIQRALSEADPEGEKIYTANAERYIAQLKDLDRWIADQVSRIPPDHRLLVTNHESLGYFADRYGFKIAGTIVPSVSTGASPSAKQLARLVDRIKATGARAIFLETGANPQLAKQVAQETGIKVVTELYTHSTTDPKDPAPNYIEMMKYDTMAIVNGLK